MIHIKNILIIPQAHTAPYHRTHTPNLWLQPSPILTLSQAAAPWPPPWTSEVYTRAMCSVQAGLG